MQGIESMSNHKFLNVIFAGFDICRPHYAWMAKCAHEAGLKITHAVSPEKARQSEVAAELADYRNRFGDEVVLWLQPDGEMLDACGVTENPQFFCYFSREAKRKLARAMVELYREVFGGRFEAAAYFNLDAFSLGALKDAAPELVSVMALVFEEGINVLHGHRYFDLEWLCWTEGSPWWPWVPRKGNIAAPAGPDDERIELVCVPHLMRDMIQSFDSRDDFFSSQPMDEMRSKSVWPGNIEYTRRFFAEHLRQAENNHGYAYYQFFESPGSLEANGHHVFDEPSEDFAEVYEGYIAFLGDRVRSGAVRQLSMAEFGKWFLERFGGYTPPTLSHWRDIRFGSGKEYVWYLDENMRVALAANRGGAIVDLRPYAAKIVKESAGVDTEYLWDLSYPFLIQNHHRYTTVCKGMLEYNGIVRDLAEEFMTVAKVEQTAAETVVRFHPIDLAFGDMTCTVESTCAFTSSGEIRRTVTVRSPSKTSGTIAFCEYFRGAWGTTDLPTNLAGLVLKVSDETAQYGFPYAHKGRKLDRPDALSCEVGFPSENFRLILEGCEGGWIGSVEEGTLFQTFYTLTLEKSLALEEGISFATRIAVRRGPVRADDLDASPAKPARSARRPFKTACGPSLEPLRCPRCLAADREVHLVERGGLHRCQFCCFAADREEILRRYDEMRRENYGG